MFDEKFVSFSQAPGLLSLVGLPIVVDQSDFPGIHIAAQNLAEDFARVTQGTPSRLQIVSDERDGFNFEAVSCIIVGSIERSLLLQRLADNGKVGVSNIRGKWESYTTTIVKDPFEGCRRALVIAGSDKRGAIFGVYALSEQIGVSPWYWWADIIPRFQSEIYALPVTTAQGEPSVRFRGIFINDEAPALTGWVRENFGKYNVEFYKKVFELLLRLKANFLWPAMWPGYPNPGAFFFTDDEKNQEAAEEYGICISTSHHEPMQRMSNEWFAENAEGSWNWLTNKESIIKFFDNGVRRATGCESYFTLGMRGEYDKKMVTDDPAAVVREVIETQRALIKEVHGREDAVPQLLALYKEVQQQYESNRLEVPDDVTLLFADDNFGAIRRLPTRVEAKRKGGAGIYYHFEYVGHPRSYKWTNSNSLGKTWHQLQEAHRRGARQIWIFNVGDIKPLEIPLNFAMELAWDINSIKENNFAHFYNTMAEREFGSEFSQEVSVAWHEYDRLISLRKHEHIEPYTFALLHYNEAEHILRRWKVLLDATEIIYKKASSIHRPSIFQLILHPIKSSYIFIALQISLGRNQLYARQRRNYANALAQQVLELFDADFSLTEEYHALLNGKWNHIMMQPHYGFGDTWHAPSRDMIGGLYFVQRRQNSNPIAGQMGIAVEGHEGVRPGRCNEESDRTHPSRRDLVPGLTLGAMTRYGPENRWFDVYTRGSPSIYWTASVPYSWLKLSATNGTLIPGVEDARVEITVEWDQVPAEFDEEVLIDIRSGEGDFEQVHLPILGRKVPETFSGFVEADGCISIPVPFCDFEPSYRILPEVGRSSTGSVALDPVSRQSAHYLIYNAYFFSKPNSLGVLLFFNMTLDVDPRNVMEYDILVDNKLQTHRLVPESMKNGELPEGWAEAVQDCVWVKRHIFIGDKFGPGTHTIRVKLKHSNLLLEKVVVDLGGLKESYLGPPPSFRTHILE
ncbi:glycoside hydrolase family 115 protein [Stipitochalara longipes BDJ]|nr:glycoside hydrolase family 115 protein [Stipitochalara longipes BDJ]